MIRRNTVNAIYTLDLVSSGMKVSRASFFSDDGMWFICVRSLHVAGTARVARIEVIFLGQII